MAIRPFPAVLCFSGLFYSCLHKCLLTLIFILQVPHLIYINSSITESPSYFMPPPRIYSVWGVLSATRDPFYHPWNVWLLLPAAHGPYFSHPYPILDFSYQPPADPRVSFPTLFCLGSSVIRELVKSWLHARHVKSLQLLSTVLNCLQADDGRDVAEEDRRSCSGSCLDCSPQRSMYTRVLIQRLIKSSI